ncbi:TPA: hypothetical protein ACGWFB_001417 [Salmonella enterica subsp. enterica serovar Jangwani]|uniref:hypothetical protein n=1 Tax=Salmonella enterica TaxID=28901 RepID=UPI00370EECD1|nr:hypothetical protein [Salmonella enterica]EIS7723295.1 hypothetical protein [Salmonella enterica]
MSSNNTVTQLRPNQDISRQIGHHFTDYAYSRHGGGNGGGDDMLKRVEKLEEKIASISTDLAVIKATMCTKEDLHKELNGQTWKIVIALVITVLIAVFSKYYIK